MADRHKAAQRPCAYSCDLAGCYRVADMIFVVMLLFSLALSMYLREDAAVEGGTRRHRQPSKANVRDRRRR